jgi:hypothetical protein
MKSEDSFDLAYGNKEYQNIKNINVNIDNLLCSSLPRKDNKEKDITLTVYGDKSVLKSIKQIRVFKRFIKNNSDRIESIQLEGFSPLLTDILPLYAKSYGIETQKEERKSHQLKR